MGLDPTTGQPTATPLTTAVRLVRRPAARRGAASLDDPAVEALHRVELGLEWFHRAHGHLVAFHHNTGHAMDPLRRRRGIAGDQGARRNWRTNSGRFLPCGVLDDRWSYDVLETFQDGLLDDAETFEVRARERSADGDRHVAERAQEKAWKGRAEEQTE